MTTIIPAIPVGLQKSRSQPEAGVGLRPGGPTVSPVQRGQDRRLVRRRARSRRPPDSFNDADDDPFDLPSSPSDKMTFFDLTAAPAVTRGRCRALPSGQSIDNAGLGLRRIQRAATGLGRATQCRPFRRRSSACCRRACWIGRRWKIAAAGDSLGEQRPLPSRTTAQVLAAAQRRSVNKSRCRDGRPSAQRQQRRRCRGPGSILSSSFTVPQRVAAAGDLDSAAPQRRMERRTR